MLTRMKSGFAVIGDAQFLPGYCLLLAMPRANHARREFLFDMSLLGEAAMRVCQPRHINYEISGNADPFLHAHVFPRYEWEQEGYRSRPVGHYPREIRDDERYQFSETRHRKLKESITVGLLDLMWGSGVGVAHSTFDAERTFLTFHATEV